MSAGLDSISATELSTSLGTRLDTELPQTLLFDHPSLRSIADSLAIEDLEAPSVPRVACGVDAHATSAQAATPRQNAATTARSVDGIRETILAVVLDVQGTAVAVETPLMSAGLDSISATELGNVLAERFDTELP